jgi:CRISPR-associated protein Cas2
MALNQPQLYLIAYDICDPRRLGRVHRYLRGAGFPVQYSVFTARLNDRQLKRLMTGLAALIHPGGDDIRLYPLPARLDKLALGLQIFPDDVLLLEGGVNVLLN